jgi:HK97 gp10 family phage protein
VSHTASAPGEPPAVDTGFLRNSIQVDEVTPNEAIIAPHTDYAEHVEFGTSRMAARPYMRPALDEHEREIVDAIEATVAAFVESVRA